MTQEAEQALNEMMTIIDIERDMALFSKGE